MFVHYYYSTSLGSSKYISEMILDHASIGVVMGLCIGLCDWMPFRKKPMLANSQRSGLRIPDHCELPTQSASAALESSFFAGLNNSLQRGVRTHTVCELVRIANYQHRKKLTCIDFDPIHTNSQYQK
jgi:hypothetical protein